MKIAALVYGEYREFEKAVKSWDIFKNLDIDYYFSTWNTSQQTCKDLGIDKKIDVNHEMINNFYPNISSASAASVKPFVSSSSSPITSLNFFSTSSISSSDLKRK